MASIRNRGDKWQARIKRDRILAEKSFTTKRDAERWARQIESQIDRGEYEPPSEDRRATMLSDLLTRYHLEVANQHRSPTSSVNINTINKMLGTTRLNDLNAQLIARWRDERLEEVKPQSVARELNTLSAVLNHARKEWCYQIDNPVPNIKKPSQGASRARRLLPGEESKLLGELLPHYASIVRFALATAMRRGEILSLRWSDTDIASRVALLPMTKNGTARRVPLSLSAITVLEEQRQQPVQAIDGRVFAVHHISLDKAWRRACKRAGIADLHFHDLRHEAISRLFEIGLNPMEVAAISGHKAMSMLARYTHLRAEDLARRLG